ncbi:MAG: T9SS type A sorting domain-containing protein [Chitinophagales bacterium]|nr:T9SS type A sorting domain-containing protein [Chitinophagales bacterium]
MLSAVLYFKVSEVFVFLLRFWGSISSTFDDAGSFTGEGEYTHGDAVVVTVQPNTGYRFINWSENGTIITGNKIYLFQINRDRELVANFEKLKYNINLTTSNNNGGIATGGGQYEYNDTMTIIAQPNTDYHFENWTENGNIISTDSIYSFVAKNNRTIKANFEKDNEYTVNISASPTDAGSVSGGGIVLSNEEMSVSVHPAEGYIFLNWTEDENIVSTDSVYTFAVTYNRNLVAHFEKIIYSINLLAQPTEGGNLIGDGAYPYKEIVTVTAIPAPRYRFENWTEADEIVSTENEYQFVVNEDRTLTANFLELKDTFDLVYTSGIGGFLQGDSIQRVEEGQSGSEIEAIALNGFVFVKWSDDVIDNPRIDTNVQNNIEVEALFLTITEIKNSVSAHLKVYPNPVQNLLNISWDGSEKAFYSLLSINGQVLQSGLLQEANNHIYLDKSPSGLLILRIETHDGVAHYKLVKQ